MSVIQSLQWRYATKKFDNTRSLSDNKITVLKDAFNLTATSYGLQPIRLVVLQNKELQQELVAPSFGQAQVRDASHVLIFCIENTIDTDYIVQYFENVKKIRSTEDKILAPFRSQLVDSFGEKTKEEIKLWATKQAYLAMGNLLTVCALEQIDACPMEGFDPKAYNRILQLEKQGITSVLVLPVGFRAEDDMFASFKKVRRKKTESIITLS